MLAVGSPPRESWKSEKGGCSGVLKTLGDVFWLDCLCVYGDDSCGLFGIN